MAHIKVYSYKRTGELLRDDAPYSIRTIERMVADGDLERIGERQRRGITERSIIAYQAGERGIWRSDARTNDARPAPATPPRRQTARTPATTRDSAGATTSSAASIPARLPKRGLIRS